MRQATVQTLDADDLDLSIILPFFKKLQEFRKVLALNLSYFANPQIEVVIVMDDSSDESAMSALLEQHPRVRCKLIVNDAAHP